MKLHHTLLFLFFIFNASCQQKNRTAKTATREIKKTCVSVNMVVKDSITWKNLSGYPVTFKADKQQITLKTDEKGRICDTLALSGKLEIVVENKAKGTKTFIYEPTDKLMHTLFFEVTVNQDSRAKTALKFWFENGEMKWAPA